jgi:SAM-dependent methyltransferase
MRWLLKAALQKGMSALPAAESANYVFQRHVTRTLPAPDPTFRRKFGRALRHLVAYAEHGPRRAVGEAVFYEFGAGWDLEIPLAYWCLGVDRQILVDIRPNLRLGLVNETVRRLARLLPQLEKEAGRTLRDPGPADLRAADELEPRFGITYLAPRDARATGLKGGAIDFVSSTNTLEHVPAADMIPVLAECRRLLRPDGAMSSRIDLRDHYAYFDSSLSPYNFLRYGERTWRLFNSALLHQNRLRRPDYLEAFAAADFTVVAEESAVPGDADLAALGRIRPAAEFGGYALEDLGVKGLALVARPEPVRSPDASEELEDLARGGGTRVGPGPVSHDSRLGHER